MVTDVVTKGIIALLLTFVIGVVYYYVDPSLVPWMPKCPFKLITELDCPACGNQRALHSMLHGDWVSAWKYNPFLIVSSPYLLALAYSVVLPNCETKSSIQNRHIANIYLIAICVWWILRNIV